MAYAITVDGFIEIKRKAIRNPENPLIVWMLRKTWERLADHSSEGLFYIPCRVGMTEPAQLRMLVNQLEIADAS